MAKTGTYFVDLDDVPDEQTSHGDTSKQVLKGKSELANALTQIAFGSFKSSQSCPLHEHSTMFEYFFFLRGTGRYLVGDDEISLKPNMLVEIPPKTNHQLIADENECALEFLYWSVAVD